MFLLPQTKGECSPFMSIGQHQWMHQLLKSTVHDSILVQLIGADPLTDTSLVELKTMVTNWDQCTEPMTLEVAAGFVSCSRRWSFCGAESCISQSESSRHVDLSDRLGKFLGAQLFLYWDTKTCCGLSCLVVVQWVSPEIFPALCWVHWIFEYPTDSTNFLGPSSTF